MKPNELNSLLLKEIPELNDKFEEVTSWQDGIDTGSFIVFEDVFMVKLEECVEINDLKMINKMYDFIEKLSFIKDDYVENILIVSILENIMAYVNNDKYANYLRLNSKKMYESIKNKL